MFFFRLQILDAHLGAHSAETFWGHILGALSWGDILGVHSRSTFLGQFHPRGTFWGHILGALSWGNFSAQRSKLWMDIRPLPAFVEEKGSPKEISNRFLDGHRSTSLGRHWGTSKMILDGHLAFVRR